MASRIENCMAALLGRDEHGCWMIDPATEIRRATRRYRPGTMILETEFACSGGRVRLIDFMPLERHSVVRIVEGLDGSVPVDVSLAARFGYGHYLPWLRQLDGAIVLTSAPDSLVLRTTARLEPDEHDVRGVITVTAGDRIGFELTWFPASQPPPPPLDWQAELDKTERLTTEWSGRSTYRGPYRDTIRAIERTLVRDGFVLRYQPEHAQDGLAGSEGAFLACSFWLVDAYAYAGRRRDAEALFERLLALRNDLGLLSEEFEPRSGRLIGNFPQAFSHLALVHSASVLAGAELTPRSRSYPRTQERPAPQPTA